MIHHTVIPPVNGFGVIMQKPLQTPFPMGEK